MNKFIKGWLIAGIVLIAILLYAYFHSSSIHVISASSKEYQQMLDELMSVETISRPPVPGSSGNTLACIYNTDVGRGIYLVNLETLKKTFLPLTNDVRRVAGWSPDGRYLAFE